MSGGHWNYTNDYLCNDIFGYRCEPGYGIGSKSQSDNAMTARIVNPMDDRMVSEMVYDVFCLLHSYDWCISGDTNSEDYRADLIAFKKKWLSRDGESLIDTEIDKRIDMLRKEIKDELSALVSTDGDDV